MVLLEMEKVRRREKKFCSDPEDLPIEDLLIVSHPKFLLEMPTKKARKWNGRLGQGEENTIIMSYYRVKGQSLWDKLISQR